MRIVSWNVGGINACVKKGLPEFMKKENADAYCFQEVKAHMDKLPKEVALPGYTGFHSFAEKKGYSGVSTYAKEAPLSVINGIGIEEFDREGRVLALEYPTFILINVYFPHSNRELGRLEYKKRFNEAFMAFCARLEKRKPIVIASDFNVAHTEMDIRNAKENEGNAGFTKEERDWFSEFLKEGHIDTFREFNKEPYNYTWWSYRYGVREKNIGWRIDYFVISMALRSHLKSSTILSGVKGSDHCPISMELAP